MERQFALRRFHAPKVRPKTAPTDFARTKYMQKPPIIMPNYGKKKNTLGVPKTSVSRVLLYDNITQQQMLDVKLAHIKIEKQRAERLMDLHKKSFSLLMAKRCRKSITTVMNSSKAAKERFPQITRNMSSHSQMTGRCSVISVGDFNLPEIGTVGKHNKEIVLQLKTKSGRKKLYHSYDDTGIFDDIVPLHSFYSSVKEDPRFQCLEASLICPDQDAKCEGFAGLSPSFPKYFPKFPTFLLDDKLK